MVNTNSYFSSPPGGIPTYTNSSTALAVILCVLPELEAARPETADRLEQSRNVQRLRAAAEERGELAVLKAFTSIRKASPADKALAIIKARRELLDWAERLKGVDSTRTAIEILWLYAMRPLTWGGDSQVSMDLAKLQPVLPAVINRYRDAQVEVLLGDGCSDLEEVDYLHGKAVRLHLEVLADVSFPIRGRRPNYLNTYSEYVAEVRRRMLP